MNPQTPQAPNPSGERPLVNPGEQVMPTPAEQAPAGGTAQNAGQPAAAPGLSAKDVSAAIAGMPGGTVPAPPAAGMPTIAADQDVIEREWVDQAEAVITKTAGDPHAEEEAVETLQIDYLDKRYGHKVAKPDSGQAG